jgi:hypothetical protein
MLRRDHDRVQRIISGAVRTGEETLLHVTQDRVQSICWVTVEAQGS